MARANSACVSPLVCHDVASDRGLIIGSIVAPARLNVSTPPSARRQLLLERGQPADRSSARE
eukprot:scaffold12360_cov62-Phaeocystis_antarctica.AAC.5